MKDDSEYLLNDNKHIFQDRHLEMFVDDDSKMNEKVEIVDKQKYEKYFSECNKLSTFMKKWLLQALKSSRKKYMIMSGLNIDKL